MFKIGNITFKNNVVLAPMAGISNPAYIKVCEELGLSYAITELISAEAIIRDNKKTLEMLDGYDNLNIPVAIQLFGSNPEVMAKASKIVTRAHHFMIIDINMGCPVPKVALKSKAGSYLLKDPDKVYEIVKAVKDAVDVPVTVKIRSGWDHNSINAVDVAKKIEKAGASAISIHPRTRSDGYKGHSNWNIIKEVKENVDIPVIGNGDIKNPLDAKKMIDETNCDAVMIGRAALGNPYIIYQVNEYLNKGVLLDNITPIKKMDLCLKHLKYLLEIKNEKVAVLEMRTNAAYYLKGLPNSMDIKKELYKIKTANEFINAIEKYKNLLKCE